MNQQASHQNEADMIRYYARRANEYERFYEKPERQDDLRRLEGVLADYFSGADVLEIACGTGYWTTIIGRSAKTIVALDANEEVLEIARRKPIGTAALNFRKGDAYSLGEVGGAFTGALGAFWWSHVPRARLGEFLTGLHAKLQPHAKVAFLDNRYVEGSNTPIARIDDEGNSYQRRLLSDGSAYEVLKNFPSATELREAVAGMAEEVAVMELKYFWLLTYRTIASG